MRVCLVCHEASLTGAPKIGFEIALSLAKKHDVWLFVKEGGQLIQLPQYSSLRDRYRVLNTGPNVSDLTYRERVTEAVEALRQIEPELLYVNSISAGEWCEAGHLCGAPVVLHTHETREGLPSTLSEICTPRVLEWTDLLIGASCRAMDDLEDMTSTSMDARSRLDFGIFIDTATILAQSEAEVEMPKNVLGNSLDGTLGRERVAMCGLAQPRKGADIFFELAIQLPSYDFIWIGPWYPSETIHNRRTFERYKSERLTNFYVTGLVVNPYPYICQADTFVLTSREDPNPLVVAEALVLGRRVVAFARSGASVAMLEKYGYALSGHVDADRIVQLLPRIVEDPARWRLRATQEVRFLVDKMRKVELLCGFLERFVDEFRKEIFYEPSAPSRCRDGVELERR